MRPDDADEIRRLEQAISTPLSEAVVVWRYFDSRTLHENAARLLGAEIHDLGFVDVTLAREVAVDRLPHGHPVLASIVLEQGTLVAPTMLLTGSRDADLLLARGTRFRVTRVGHDGPTLTVGLEIVT